MLRRAWGAIVGVLMVSSAALAQNFPNKPMTMIIPFAAGGPTDVLGRVLAQRMSELLGQQVVVENIGGAGGMTGAKRVADAAGDGYTMLLGTVGTQAQSQTIYKRPLYNSLTDFTPVALVASLLLNILYFGLMIKDWAEQGQNSMMALIEVVIIGSHAWQCWSLDRLFHLFGA